MVPGLGEVCGKRPSPKLREKAFSKVTPRQLMVKITFFDW
jgi:hypothetical protein